MKQLINAWCFEHKPVTTLVVYGMEGEYKKKKKKSCGFHQNAIRGRFKRALAYYSCYTILA